MFGLTILRILVLCEPLFCLARPQYFCCLPCPLTNDCENPYYRETPIPCREEPPSLRPPNGNYVQRGNYDGFLPQVPFPPMPGPPRPRDQRSNCQGHSRGQSQDQNYGPDPNCINLTIKCNGEREAYEDPYNKEADWYRGDLPDGKFCWLLKCNDPSLRSGNDPQQGAPQSAPPPPPPPPTQPPQTPPTQPPQTPPPSQDSPPEDSNDDPSNTRLKVHWHDPNLPDDQHNHTVRRSGYSSYPEPRRRSNFFSNLFSIPGQLADSVLSGSIQLN